MKTRGRSSIPGSPAATPLFQTYLKPGALAQLRYSKITARSREVGARTLIALSQLKPRSDSEPSLADPAMDRIPRFDFRVAKHPRCLQRKKLIAVTPFFSEAQS